MLSKKTALLFLTWTVLIPSSFSSTLTKIIYKVSGRNIPADKNAFAEIQKGRPFYCRTESLRSENPDWVEICEVEFQEGENDTRLAVEMRNNIAGGADESLGWSVFFVRDMLENGKVLTEEIRNGPDPRGMIRVTVLLACVPGQPGCGLLKRQENPKKHQPLLNLKIYA